MTLNEAMEVYRGKAMLAVEQREQAFIASVVGDGVMTTDEAEATVAGQHARVIAALERGLAEWREILSAKLGHTPH